MPGCDRTDILGQQRIHADCLCAFHYRRLKTYGYLEPPDPPIPMDDAPGVSEERVAQLKAMSWKALVAYCDDVLRRQRRA